MSAIEDRWYEVGYKEGMSDSGAEITRLRAEFACRDALIKDHLRKILHLENRVEAEDHRAESAERKLAMAVEALRPFTTLRATRLMTDGCKYDFRVDAGWIRRARAALTELEKADE
jgi:hypothetical protein